MEAIAKKATAITKITAGLLVHRIKASKCLRIQAPTQKNKKKRHKTTLRKPSPSTIKDKNPVADNSTEDGRKLNRRVEVYMYASQQMINNAKAQAN